jgi:hypothetical protein
MSHIFPKDFKIKAHQVVTGAKQWTLSSKDEDGLDLKVIISVVGGGKTGLHGDGITTFEMWDFRDNDPQGYLSIDDINAHLKAHPIQPLTH